MRLHDLIGTLYLYYALHHHLPANLDELRPLTDLDTPLELNCPVSKAAYLYCPTDLSAPGPDPRLLVYDQLPVHAGHRWAILAHVANPGRPVTMWVAYLDEPAFTALLPAATPRP